MRILLSNKNIKAMLASVAFFLPCTTQVMAKSVSKLKEPVPIATHIKKEHYHAAALTLTGLNEKETQLVYGLIDIFKSSKGGDINKLSKNIQDAFADNGMLHGTIRNNPYSKERIAEYFNDKKSGFLLREPQILKISLVSKPIGGGNHLIYGDWQNQLRADHNRIVNANLVLIVNRAGKIVHMISRIHPEINLK